MNKFCNILILTAVAATLGACHTTEKNYRESYEKTLELNRSGERGELYEQEQAERTHKNYVAFGDSIRLLHRSLSVIDDKPEVEKKYGVVVAEFSQQFNALSCRNRLRQQEHLPAYVVYTYKNNEKVYYVIAQGFDDLEQATAFVKAPEKYMKMKVLVPMAWIVVNTRTTPQKNK